MTAAGDDGDPIEAAQAATDPQDGAPAAADGGAEDDGADFVLQLPAFEGPLALLLHLIEREELDITELSVLQVTEQYLTHLRSAERIDLAALADFVAMGARLLLLKSRALLPGDDEPHEGEEEESASDLVDALQEYRRYRKLAEHLRGLEDEHRTAYRRDAAPPQVPLPTGLDDVTVDGLMALFREVLERLPEQEELPEIEREPVRLADRVSALMTELDDVRQLSFRALIGRAQSRIEVIVDFMAVLELIKARFLEARQPEAFGEIELVRLDGAATLPPADLEQAIDEQ
ncbi:MAG: ScpA family protein [Dehalococcoidia bacterium]